MFQMWSYTSDSTVIYGHYTISIFRVKLSGEDLSRYSDKIESVGLRKCPYWHYLTKKVMPQWQTFLRACPHIVEEKQVA